MGCSSGLRLVLFDLDGTLSDSGPSFVNSLRFGLEGVGAPIPSEDIMRSYIGPPLNETLREELGLDDGTAAEALRLYRERFADLGVAETRAYDGISALLEALADTDLVLAVATSKPTPSAVRVLRHLGLDQYFAFVGGAEFEGVRQRKGEVIAHTLEEVGPALGLPSAAASELVDPRRVLMVGDRRHDVVGAREHGVDCIGVLWGFGSKEELVAAGAIAIADEPASLVPLLDPRSS